MIKAVIFDFDDTLVASREAKWAQHTHVAKTFFNIDLKEDKIREHWGKPVNILALELYDNSDTWENIHIILRSTRDAFPKKLHSEVAGTLEYLLGRGIKIGILSAATSSDIKHDLVKYNIPVDNFTIIQGAEDTLVHKPNPEVFIPILEHLSQEGIQNKEILYVGDSLDDLKAATGAGINFVAVTTGLYAEEDFKKAGAKKIIKNIREVLENML